VTNGSDDALALLVRTFLDASTTLIAPVPTYTHTMLFARASGARVVPFQPADVFRPDPDGLAALLRAERPRMCYLVSPNNPTGTQYDADAIAYVARACPETLLVLDEAYIEFSGGSFVPRRAEHENVVVTRTFSKAWGLAGLRVGYLIASPAVLSAVRRLHNAKSVNVLGQVAAEAALGDRSWLDRHAASVTAAHARLVLPIARPARRALGRELRVRAPAERAGVRGRVRAGPHLHPRPLEPPGPRRLRPHHGPDPRAGARAHRSARDRARRARRVPDAPDAGAAPVAERDPVV
jgi:hypothetical protein